MFSFVGKHTTKRLPLRVALAATARAWHRDSVRAGTAALSSASSRAAPAPSVAPATAERAASLSTGADAAAAAASAAGAAVSLGLDGGLRVVPGVRSRPGPAAASAALAAARAAGAALDDDAGRDAGAAGAAAPAAAPPAAGSDVMVAVFTCKQCETRLARAVSKAAYARGVVLVRCPTCTGLHVLADHLGWTDDAPPGAIDALLEARGEVVRRAGAGAAGAGAAGAGAAGAGGLAGEGGGGVTLSLTPEDVAVLRAEGMAVRAAGAPRQPAM